MSDYTVIVNLSDGEYSDYCTWTVLARVVASDAQEAMARAEAFRYPEHHHTAHAVAIFQGRIEQCRFSYREPFWHPKTPDTEFGLVEYIVPEEVR